HRFGDQRKAVEQRSPRAYLCRPEGADEPAGVPGIRNGCHAALWQQALEATGAAEFSEQPHPASPFSLATASATQHASAPAGAGPPQQDEADTAAGALQTPVSGSTRRTSRAATRSPAISATTDLACS